MKNNKNHPVDAYIKEKIEKVSLDVNYNKGASYGLENMKFNFSCEPIKEPYGDIAFTTGYDNDDRYTSTFLMTSEEAMRLGKMLIDTAYKSMDIKRIVLQAEEYETRLSLLVMKDAIDAIRISRQKDRLDNYEYPYYLYTISAYKDNDKVFTYNTAINLSKFRSEKEIDNWKESLSNFGKVKLYFDNWDPYSELKERTDKIQKDAINKLKELKLKPSPIIKK